MDSDHHKKDKKEDEKCKKHDIIIFKGLTLISIETPADGVYTQEWTSDDLNLGMMTGGECGGDGVMAAEQIYLDWLTGDEQTGWFN